MSEARSYLRKLVRIRKYLIDQGLGQKNDLGTHEAMKKIANWLEFHPKATDRQIRGYIQRNQSLIFRIMPGKDCPTHEQLLEQLNNLLYDKAKYN